MKPSQFFIDQKVWYIPTNRYMIKSGTILWCNPKRVKNFGDDYVGITELDGSSILVPICNVTFNEKDAQALFQHQMNTLIAEKQAMINLYQRDIDDLIFARDRFVSMPFLRRLQNLCWRTR